MELTIREARVQDLTSVHRIELSSYPDPWPRSLFYLMRGRAPGLFLVADIVGEVVAYAIGEVEWKMGERVGHVMNIAMAENRRRQGIASRLMDELERRFIERGATTCYLEVRVTNVAAQALYRKRGYMELGLLLGYYHDEDGLAMEKPLP